MLPLLDTLRSAHSANPLASPSELVANVQEQQSSSSSHSSGTPTPPPLAAYAPDPSRRSDSHMLAAFLLQAIFLGASGLGLLARAKVKSKERVELLKQEEAHAEDARQRRERDCSRGARDVVALNLLASAYAEKAFLEHANARAVARQLLDKGKDPMAAGLKQVLSRFGGSNECEPNHWTVAAVLAFTSQSSTPSGVTKRLNIWAWNVFHRIAASPTPSPFHNIILRTFGQLVLNTVPQFPSSDVNRVLSQLAPQLLTLARDEADSSCLGLLTSLGDYALAHRRSDVLIRLLQSCSPLPPRARFSLCARILEELAADELWREKELVAIPRLARLMVDTSAEMTLQQPDVAIVERVVKLLMDDLRHEVAMESEAADLVRAALQASLDFTPGFLPGHLRQLIDARQPRLALQVFRSLPKGSHTIDHFHPLLRSHHGPTSQFIWDLQLEAAKSRPDLAPTFESFSHRLTSHGHKDNNDLSAAYRDLCLATWMGVPRTRKMWNKLLKIVIQCGSDLSLRRQVAKMRRSGIGWDDATRNILLMRRMTGEPALDRMALRQAGITRHGAADNGTDGSEAVNDDDNDAETVRSVKGRRQMERVRDNLKHLERQLLHWSAYDEGGTAPPPDSDPVSTSRPVDLREDILLKNLTRWPREVNSRMVAQLAERTLGVDISHALMDGTTSPRREPASLLLPPPTTSGRSTHDMEHFRRVRRPAYKTLLKALRNRGSHAAFAALHEEFRREGHAVRRQSREPRERVEDEKSEREQDGMADGAVERRLKRVAL